MSKVPKLKIDSNFFNKLDSLHKSKSKKANTHTEHKSKKANTYTEHKSKSFGNTSLSVINDKQKIKKSSPKIKKSSPKIIKQESNSESDSESDSEFEIIEKKKNKTIINHYHYTKPEILPKKNNSLEIYDDDNNFYIQTKIDKRNPIYNKIINLPFHEIINITYKNNSNVERHYIHYICCLFGISVGIIIGIFIKFNNC